MLLKKAELLALEPQQWKLLQRLAGSFYFEEDKIFKNQSL